MLPLSRLNGANPARGSGLAPIKFSQLGHLGQEQCCGAGTDSSHCSQFLRFDGELGRLPGCLPLWCVAPRTMPAHPRSGEISGVRLRGLVCHRARSARSTLCLSIAPAGWFFSTVSLERCALRLVATQSRGDGNGFKLRTICCGLAVLVRIVALRATRSAEENGKQPTSN